jgi:hypothetical protein
MTDLTCKISRRSSTCAALQPPKTPDRDRARIKTCAASADVRRQSAGEPYTRERPLWPTSGEWYRPAAKLSQESGQTGSFIRDGRPRPARGYQSGEPFDVAMHLRYRRDLSNKRPCASEPRPAWALNTGGVFEGLGTSSMTT